MKMPSREIPGPPRDLVGYGRHVPRVRWPDGARVTVNFVIDMEEGSEVQMSADGRNEAILGEFPPLGLEGAYRDLALESVYEYAHGPDQPCRIAGSERSRPMPSGRSRRGQAARGRKPPNSPCRLPAELPARV